MQIENKELGDSPINIESQTNLDQKSENKENEQQEQQQQQQQIKNKPKKYVLTEYDQTTLKLAKGLIVYNLVGFVFLFVSCIAIYMTLHLNWSEDLLASLIMFIISDTITICERILFFSALIHKFRCFKLCLLLNICTYILKIVASAIVINFTICPMIASLIMFCLQAPHVVTIKMIVNRWNIIPNRKWKKQLILVRKPLPIK